MTPQGPVTCSWVRRRVSSPGGLPRGGGAVRHRRSGSFRSNGGRDDLLSATKPSPQPSLIDGSLATADGHRRLIRSASTTNLAASAAGFCSCDELSPTSGGYPTEPVSGCSSSRGNRSADACPQQVCDGSQCAGNVEAPGLPQPGSAAPGGSYVVAVRRTGSKIAADTSTPRADSWRATHRPSGSSLRRPNHAAPCPSFATCGDIRLRTGRVDREARRTREASRRCGRHECHRLARSEKRRTSGGRTIVSCVARNHAAGEVMRSIHSALPWSIGASRIRSVPETNAFGGHVCGSNAIPWRRWVGSRRSPV